MKKYLDNELLVINLAGEVPPNDRDSMCLWYEFSVCSESERFIAYETLQATQFTGYYHREITITVDHKSITVREIRECFSEAHATGSFVGAIQEHLDKGELQFSGYADLFIDQLNSKNVGFELAKNEIT